MENETIIIPTALYYRHSRDSNTRIKNFRNNNVVYDESQLIQEMKDNLTKACVEFEKTCPNCRRTIKAESIGHTFYDINESGQKLDRDEFNLLREEVSKGTIKLIITPYASRIGRRKSVSATIRDEFRDIGVQIYSIHEPVTIYCPDCFDPFYDDSNLMVESMSDLSSELTLRSIRRNTQGGLQARFKSGKPPTSLAFGLTKRIKVVGADPHGNDVIGTMYEWDPEAVKLLQRIKSEYFAGKGLWNISSQLNREKIPSPQKGLWGRNALKTILQNPSYAGYVRFGWKAKAIKNGKKIREVQPFEKWKHEKSTVFEGLEGWDWNTYIKILDMFKSRARMGGRAVSSDGLLIGILKCGECGGGMIQGHSKKTRLDGTIYSQHMYKCRAHAHHGTCIHNGVMQHIIEKAVLAEVSKLFNDETKRTYYTSILNKKKADLSETLASSRITISKLEKEMERVKEAYERGIDTIDEYASSKNRINRIIVSTKAEIESLEKQINSNKQVLTIDASFSEAINNFMSAPTPQLRKKVKEILSRLIERIEYKKLGTGTLRWSQDNAVRSINIVYKLNFDDSYYDHPTEDGEITVSRTASTVTFPAKFILLAACNPCPCGFAYSMDPGKQCSCSSSQLTRYKKKLSGPILDRIDLQVKVRAVPIHELSSRSESEKSASIKERVQDAREIQYKRFADTNLRSNAEMTSSDVRSHCILSPDAEELLKSAVTKMHLSARAYNRTIKVARTIADLSHQESITKQHIAESLQFRFNDNI